MFIKTTKSEKKFPYKIRENLSRERNFKEHKFDSFETILRTNIKKQNFDMLFSKSNNFDRLFSKSNNFDKLFSKPNKFRSKLPFEAK